MAKTLNIISRKNTDTNWYKANPYTDNDIDTIPDAEGATATKQITSIPSPFARVDLFKSAFRSLVEQARTDGTRLNGNTIHHKLVSETLDLAQLFFNMDALKEDAGKHIEIIVWEREKQLAALRASGNANHKILADTLDLYLQQDREAYNFGQWQQVFLLSYEYKIIGATSPATMFFSTGNDNSFVKIKFGSDTLFDSDFCPLYKRELEFQKYFYLLFHAYANELSATMKEMKEYLDLNIKQLATANPAFHKEIQDAMRVCTEQSFKNDYMELNAGSDGQLVQVLGVPMRKRKVNKGAVQAGSDFVIASTKCTDALKPLVLQNNFMKPSFRYVSGGSWEANTLVPFADAAPLEKRKLPNQNEIYPYLTVDDFLEPYLIKMIYPLNSDNYFDGNMRNSTADGYLLPIKKAYFNYFDSSKLKETLPNGQPIFQLETRTGGGVLATLRIPIAKSGEFISLERMYFPPMSEYELRKPNISALTNEGAIVQCKFGVAVTPFVQTSGSAHYRAMLIDADTQPHTLSNEYALRFFSNTQTDTPLAADMRQRSDKRMNKGATTKFYIVNNPFDVIELNNGSASGLLIPNFKASGGATQFTFSVDFGTTNTHIEYSKDRVRPVPFEASSSDALYAATYPKGYFIDAAPEIELLILHELLPETLGKANASEFRFPQRTAVSENKTLNHISKIPEALADINIPFYFEKQLVRPESKVTTDLKWSNYTQEQDDQNRVAKFIETLLLAMRNKVLMNGGNLATTKLVWFYPSSMMVNRREKLRRIWNEGFAKFIAPVVETYDGKGNNVVMMSESVAPYYHYFSYEGVSSAAYPAISIDIGGGTTDVVAFFKNQPVFLTSFRFAGNAVFGDAFRGAANMNGFVQKYRPKVEQVLRESGQADLIKILESLNEQSSDIISFFFSLEGNKKLQDAKIALPFSQWLSDDEDLKIVFLVFYGAILYHIAKLMQKTGLAMPRFVCFGGNGSKMLDILDHSLGANVLGQFSKLMFEGVFAQKYGEVGQTEALNIKKVAEPKELTCKGGLSDKASDMSVEDMMIVLLGDQSNTLVNNSSPKFASNQLLYSQLTTEHYQNICTEVKTFVDIFFNINTQMNFNRYFGINTAKTDFYKQTLSQDLITYLLDGIDIKQQTDLAGDPNAALEETLFFYPLIGALNQMASKIVMG